MQQKQTAFGVFQTQTTCPTCRGQGEIIKDPCDHCNGTGHEVKEKKIKVSIPAGVDEGTRLRMSGEGEAGERNAPKGDLYIYIHVKPNDIFIRDGADLYIDVPLRFSQAAEGDTIEIPHILGKANLKIPSGTQPGTLLRMKGKGLPHLRGNGNGDQYVRVTIDVPTKLTKKQKELLKQFDKESKEKKPHEKLFDKIKEAFK
jgi:molecular chaperone DnaJ